MDTYRNTEYILGLFFACRSSFRMQAPSGDNQPRFGTFSAVRRDDRGRAGKLSVFRLYAERYLLSPMCRDDGSRDGCSRTRAASRGCFEAECEGVRVFYPEGVNKNRACRDRTAVIDSATCNMHVRQCISLLQLPYRISTQNDTKNSQ